MEEGCEEMTIYFSGGNFQTKSVLKPIYDYASKMKSDVAWGSGIPKISCSGSDKHTFYIPHGVSAENFVATRVNIQKGAQIILFPGPYWKEHFANPSPPQVSKYGGLLFIEVAKNYPKERIKVVGWPKSDLIFSSKRKGVEERWKNKLHLRHDKTVLLTSNHYMKNLAEETAGLELNFIIKPHILQIHNTLPFFRGATKEQHFSVPEMKSKLGKFKHIIWIDPEKLSDITELFLISDVLVSSPGSSVATEFMVTGKPVISFPSRDVYYASGFKFEKEECPAVCCGVDGIRESITRCIEKPNEFRKQQEAWLEKMIYKPDGNASKRAWEAIMEVLN